ncbi:suppressor of lurcher protein 1-like [Panulirus ornatus]|uniref:suppressor of lurcher protein 1-like n=1 Tax=Panulirus ornatus TaxID=150431 RepID=UPI003A87C1BA
MATAALSVGRWCQLSAVPLFLLLLLLSDLPGPQQSSGKRLGGNEVFSCNEVVEAWLGSAGEWRGMNGSLESPNFPRPYPARLQCRVDLKAPPEHRIQLAFTHFLLFHPLNLSNRNCDAMDSVTISGASKNKIGTFCGAGVPRPVMSSGPYLSLVFRSYTSGPHVTGYRAIYKFLRNFGLTTGQQLDHHPCVFEYNSTLHPTGEFHSPNPGGIYPRNTVCHYIFRGSRHEKVKLEFKYFDIEGVAPCSAKSDSDYVEFSNHPTQDFLPRRCGRFAPKVVESEGPFFRVTFRSNHKFDGTGFAAAFQFLPNDDDRTMARPLSLATAGADSWASLAFICVMITTSKIIIHQVLLL